MRRAEQAEQREREELFYVTAEQRGRDAARRPARTARLAAGDSPPE